MKYFGVICVIGMLICSSCSRDSWSKTDQDEFLSTCFTEGGSKEYCTCFLKKMMDYCPISEEVEQINFEQKVELANDCD